MNTLVGAPVVSIIAPVQNWFQQHGETAGFQFSGKAFPKHSKQKEEIRQNLTS